VKSEYPKRPPFFALKFTRLMAKVCLANHCGQDAAWLLTVIAGVEDAKSYRSAVTFFNEQLMPLVGCKSVDSLARTRAKAVASGWLHYEPGGKGIAGKYWVTIPGEYDRMDDTPADENSAEYGEFTTANLRREPRDKHVNHRTDAEESAERTAREPRGKCGENREESAEHSSLTFPVPNPRENPTPSGIAGTPKTPATKFNPSKIQIPEELRSPVFETAWRLWVEVRTAKGAKGKLTEHSVSAQFRKLIPLGPDRAADCINDSIANSWQGLFPEKFTTSGRPPPRFKTAQESRDEFLAQQFADAGIFNPPGTS